MFHLLSLGVFFATFVALDAQQCYRCFGRHWCNDASHPDFESNVTIINCPATAAQVPYEGNSPTIAKFIHSLERLSTSSGGEDALSQTLWGCVTATIHEAHEVHTIRTCVNNAETICRLVQTVVLDPELNDVPDEVGLDCGGCIGVLCNDLSFVTPDAPGTSSTANPEASTSSTATPDSTTSSTTAPSPETSTTTTDGPGSTTSSPTIPSSSSTTTTTTTTTSATTPSPETTTSTSTTATPESTTSSPTTPISSSTATPESSTATSESTEATASTTTEITTSTTTTTPETSSTTSEVPETTEKAPETTTTGSGQAFKVSYGLLMLTLCIEWIRYIRA